MYKKIVSSIYVLNILFQALYSLALPIGIGALAAFLLTKYVSAPKWIWAVLLLIGVFTGLFSMIKFILTATKNLDRLEKERAEKDALEKAKAKKQAELRCEKNIKESDGENNEKQ